LFFNRGLSPIVCGLSPIVSLPNVPVVGGSWVVTQQDLQEKNWKNISAKAQAMAV
jgi:2-keto-3-deoxy-6-phosphogluconate aldolase